MSTVFKRLVEAGESLRRRIDSGIKNDVLKGLADGSPFLMAAREAAQARMQGDEAPDAEEVADIKATLKALGKEIADFLGTERAGRVGTILADYGRVVCGAKSRGGTVRDAYNDLLHGFEAALDSTAPTTGDPMTDKEAAKKSLRNLALDIKKDRKLRSLKEAVIAIRDANGTDPEWVRIKQFKGIFNNFGWAWELGTLYQYAKDIGKETGTKVGLKKQAATNKRNKAVELSTRPLTKRERR